MENVILKRIDYQKKQTLGTLSYKGKEIAKTMELPWLNNSNRISCIPEGTYKVVRRTSLAKGKHFHILNVPGRTYILIHVGNYNKDILGCVAVGDKFADINKDGLLDVTDSRKTMERLLKDLPLEFNLIIKS